MGSQSKRKKGTKDNRSIVSDIKRETDQDANRTALQPTFEGLAYSPVGITQTDYVDVTDSIDPLQTNAPTAPTIVTGLDVTVGGDNALNLIWTANASPGVISYNIYRSKTSGAESLITSVSIPATNYQDTNVIAGTTYYYKVAAVNAYGLIGPWSAEDSAITTGSIPSVPAQVTGLNITVGTNELDLAWTVPSSNPALTYYNIYRTTASTSEVFTSFTNSYNDTAVILGTIYYYKVAAVNAVGTGILSTEISGTLTIPIGPPLAPSGLVVSSITTSTAVLNCNIAQANPAPTSYKFYYSTSPSFSPGFVMNPSAPNTGITLLQAGTLYYVKCSAVNSYGEGAFSLTVIFTTQSISATLLLHLDGNLTDSAGGAVLNTSHQSNGFITSGAKFGSGALRLNYPTDPPTGKDYFEVNETEAGIAYDFKFSLSFWIYPQDISALTNRRVLAAKREDIANKWQIDLDSSGVVRFNVRTGGSDSVYEIGGFITNSWQMVTVTWNINTGTYKIYRNAVAGISSATAAQGLQEPPAAAFNRLLFGKRADNEGTTYFEGYYDEVQYFKGIELTQAQITNLFNINAPDLEVVTPPSSIFPMLEFHFDNIYDDTSPNTFNIGFLRPHDNGFTAGQFGSAILVNTPVTPSSSQKEGFYIVGSETEPLLNMNTSIGFTFSGWVYPVDLTHAAGYRRFIIEKRDDANNTWHLSLDSAGVLYFQVTKAGTTYKRQISGFVLNSWQHIGAVFNGATNTVEVYRNGVAGVSSTAADSTGTAIDNKLIIGCRYDSNPTTMASTYYEGTLDEFRFYQKILTSTQINNLKNTNVP